MIGLGADARDLLAADLPRGRLVRLAALTVAASLSEGVGLVLLVPALVAIGAPAGSAAGWPLALLRWAPGLGTILVLVVALVAVRALIVRQRQVLELEVQTVVCDRVRARLFAALLGARWRHLAGFSASDLVAQLVGTIDSLGNGLRNLFAFLTAACTLVAMLAAAMLIAPLPALVFGAGGVAVLAVYAGLRRKAVREGEDVVRGFGTVIGWYSGRLAALRLIKSFGAEQAEQAHGIAISDALSRTRLDYQRGLADGQLVLQLGAAVVLAGGIWTGITRFGAAPSQLLPLVALGARCIPLLGSVQTGWQNWAHARPALDQLAALHAGALAAYEDTDVARAAPALARGIVVEDVSLTFAAREVSALEHVTLRIGAGEVVALEGPSGSGKSTLADILAGLTTPDSGRVIIDGIALDLPLLAAWRRRVAYVQQEPVLFDDTVRGNLVWGRREASEEVLRRALADASAGFVLDLPRGLDTPVGDAGRALSGGERQRIVLARALLRDPALLILDEATSALDPANDAAIAEAVARLRGRMTIVVIGHHGSLARIADRTVALNRGRLELAA